MRVLQHDSSKLAVQADIAVPMTLSADFSVAFDGSCDLQPPNSEQSYQSYQLSVYVALVTPVFRQKCCD